MRLCSVGIFFILVGDLCADAIVPYDRSFILNFRTFLQAIEQQDDQQAFQVIEKLAEDRPSALLHRLKETFRANILIEDAKKHLAQGHYQHALQILEESVLNTATYDEYKKIQILLTLKNYLQEMTKWERAEEASIAFARLPTKANHQLPVFYETWYKKQKKSIATLIQKEKKQRIQRWIGEYDLAAVQSSRNRLSFRRKFFLVIKGNKEHWKKWGKILFDSQDDANILRVLHSYQVNSQEKNLQENAIIDFVLFHILTHGGSRVRKKALTMLEKHQTTTLTGKLLKSQVYARKGEFFPALVMLWEIDQEIKKFDGSSVYGQAMINYKQQDIPIIAPSLYAALLHLYSN